MRASAFFLIGFLVAAWAVVATPAGSAEVIPSCVHEDPGILFVVHQCQALVCDTGWPCEDGQWYLCTVENLCVYCPNEVCGIS